MFISPLDYLRNILEVIQFNELFQHFEWYCKYTRYGYLRFSREPSLSISSMILLYSLAIFGASSICPC